VNGVDLLTPRNASKHKLHLKNGIKQKGRIVEDENKTRALLLRKITIECFIDNFTHIGFGFLYEH